MTTFIEEASSISLFNGNRRNLHNGNGTKKQVKRVKKNLKEQCHNDNYIGVCNDNERVLRESELDFAVKCNRTDKLIFVEIYTSDVVNRPIFPVNEGKVVKRRKQNIPFQVVQSKVKLYADFSSVIKAKISEQDSYEVYEVVVHSLCLAVLEKQPNLLNWFFTYLCQALESQNQLDLDKDSCISFVDNFQYEKQRNGQSELACMREKSHNFGPNIEEKLNTKPVNPEYKLKYINHVSLQDFSYSNINNSAVDSIGLEVYLPGILKAEQINVIINENRHFHLDTNCKEYSLDIKFTYPVDDQPAKALYATDSYKLFLEFPILKKRQVVASSSIDSGIGLMPEWEQSNGHEEKVDEYELSEDNSDEGVELSEDVFHSDACAETNFQCETEVSDSDSSESSTHYFDSDSLEEPKFRIKHLHTELNFEVDANLVDPVTIQCELLGDSLAKFYYSHERGGTLPIQYGFFVDVAPLQITDESLSYYVVKVKGEKKVHFIIHKSGNVKTIKIGQKMDELIELHIPMAEKNNHGKKKKKGTKSSDQSNTVECGPQEVPKPRTYKLSTGSYPKGILKGADVMERSRTKSESVVHDYPDVHFDKKVCFNDKDELRKMTIQFDRSLEKHLKAEAEKRKLEAKKRTQSECPDNTDHLDQSFEDALRNFSFDDQSDDENSYVH